MRGFLLQTLLFVPVPLLFLAISISQFFVTVRYYDLIYAARLIESGKPVSLDYIDTLLDKVEAKDIVCRHDVVMAIMTTRFHTLDMLNASSTDPDKWQKALAQAGQYAEKSLTCFPTNGTLWLRLAVVRWASNASSEDLATSMTRSQHFAPVETAALLGRLDLWNRMSRRAINAAEPAARADIAAYERYFRTRWPDALQSPSPAIKDLIASTDTSGP